MEDKVKIGEQEFVIRELKYRDISSLNKDDQEAASRKMIVLSTGMTDEQYNELTIKEGLTIQKKINDLNGLDDFQKATAPK